MRKIGIAVIGVFGAAMEEMQVSLTLVLVFFIILLTAIQRPYGESKNAMLLQRVELSTLCMLYLTLWAAGIFTLYPRCEVREGESLWWCELMSVLVGLADAALVIFVILLFVWLKGADAGCLKRLFGKLPEGMRESLTRVGSKAVLEWDMWLGGEAAVQARIRARTVDAEDTSMMDNPFADAEDTSMMDNPFARRHDGGGGSDNMASTLSASHSVEMVAIDVEEGHAGRLRRANTDGNTSGTGTLGNAAMSSPLPPPKKKNRKPRRAPSVPSGGASKD